MITDRDYQAYAEYVICFVKHTTGAAPIAAATQLASTSNLLHGHNTLQVCKEYKVVESAEVRSGPRTASELLGWLEPGHFVPALDENRNAGDNHHRLKISNTPEQWVSATTSRGCIQLLPESDRVVPVEFVSLDPPRFK